MFLFCSLRDHQSTTRYNQISNVNKGRQKYVCNDPTCHKPTFPLLDVNVTPLEAVSRCSTFAVVIQVQQGLVLLVTVRLWACHSEDKSMKPLKEKTLFLDVKLTRNWPNKVTDVVCWFFVSLCSCCCVYINTVVDLLGTYSELYL